MVADGAERLAKRGGELGGTGRLVEGMQDRGAGRTEQAIKTARSAGGRLVPFPERGDPARWVGKRRLGIRLQAQGELRPDEYRGDEQQATPIEPGVLLWPQLQFDGATTIPAHARMQSGQRGGPALRGELPGPVHQITLEEGAQHRPLGFEKCLPRDGEHIGDVVRQIRAGEDVPNPAIQVRLAAAGLRDVVLYQDRGSGPHLFQQILDRA